MSEKLKHTKEDKLEKADLSAEAEASLKRAERAAEKAIESEPKHVETGELKQEVEQHALSSDETLVDKKEETASHEFGGYAELKSQTYSQTLRKVRSRLSSPEQALRKVMHNKAVESASNVVGRTAARPSGILGGGIFALLGSSILLYMSKSAGFEYNFFVFFIFLGGGFIVGVLVELIIRFIRKARR